MKKFRLTISAFILGLALAGCSEGDHGHEHGHDGGHAHDSEQGQTTTDHHDSIK